MRSCAANRTGNRNRNRTITGLKTQLLGGMLTCRTGGVLQPIPGGDRAAGVGGVGSRGDRGVHAGGHPPRLQRGLVSGHLGSREASRPCPPRARLLAAGSLSGGRDTWHDVSGSCERTWTGVSILNLWDDGMSVPEAPLLPSGQSEEMFGGGIQEPLSEGTGGGTGHVHNVS